MRCPTRPLLLFIFALLLHQWPRLLYPVSQELEQSHHVLVPHEDRETFCRPHISLCPPLSLSWADSKSGEGKLVWVRVPPPALCKMPAKLTAREKAQSAASKPRRHLHALELIREGNAACARFGQCEKRKGRCSRNDAQGERGALQL